MKRIIFVLILVVFGFLIYRFSLSDEIIGFLEEKIRGTSIENILDAGGEGTQGSPDKKGKIPESASDSTPTSDSTPIPDPTPIPNPTPNPLPIPGFIPTLNFKPTTPEQKTSFLVKPFIVYPADKKMYPEYETAVKDYLREMQDWYSQKVGARFSMLPLWVVRSPRDYLNMRCGDNPSQSCINNPALLEGNWGKYMNEAIHDGAEKWEEENVALIFSAGGGGYAGASQGANYTGWAITGDWVLEPLSGKANEWGIPCSYSDGWQCEGGVSGGSPAHELGHAFGLPHPDEYDGKSIMKWHGDYPDVGFLPHEIEFLRNSPFFE